MCNYLEKRLCNSHSSAAKHTFIRGNRLRKKRIVIFIIGLAIGFVCGAAVVCLIYEPSIPVR